MSKSLRALNRELKRAVERTVIIVSREVNAELVNVTPLDTGHAYSNWVASIGAPWKDVAGTYEAATRGDIDLGPQSSGFISVSTAYTLQRGAIYITNNVPYISLLNTGWSDQAPSGFVQIAILNVIRRLTGRRIRL